MVSLGRYETRGVMQEERGRGRGKWTIRLPLFAFGKY